MLNTDDLRHYTGIGTGYTQQAMMNRAADEIDQLREALKIASAATEQLMQAGKEAAEMIYREAVCLRDCHTVDGVWDGQEPDVLAEYEYMIALADRLTPNVEVSRGAEAPDRSAAVDTSARP